MRKAAVLFLILICGTASGETFYSSSVTTFASPDNSYTTLDSFIEGAETALYVNVYTFDNPYVALELLEAHERGVDVTILVDASPVGGISDNEWKVLNNLSGAGIPVYLWSDADLGFNHAKYVVADNMSVLVATENLGTTGFPITGTTGNRGWGAIVEGSTSLYFADLFFTDLENGEQVDFTGFSPLDFYYEEKEYVPQFGSKTFPGNFTIVPVVAPENAVESILELINSASETLYIEEFYVYRFWGSKKNGYVDNPFLEASIDAARRGVEVKILLDSTWYNIEEDDLTSNFNTAKYVNGIAADEGL
ncbi:phospholipase, partial [archaeon]|nr:phospholipase [archaeon]